MSALRLEFIVEVVVIGNDFPVTVAKIIDVSAAFWRGFPSFEFFHCRLVTMHIC